MISCAHAFIVKIKYDYAMEFSVKLSEIDYKYLIKKYSKLRINSRNF